MLYYTRMVKRGKIMASIGISGALIVSSGVLFVPMTEVAAVDTGDIQDSIKKAEKKLEAAQQKADSIQKDLNQITGSLVVTKQIIANTSDLLSKTESTIGEKESAIKALDSEILLQKKLLGDLMRNLYENGNIPLSEIVLNHDEERLSLAESDTFLTLQDKIGMIADDLEAARGNTEEEKKILEDAKTEHERLLRLKGEQEKTLTAAKNETQADLRDQQATIGELQGKISKLKSSLSDLLGKSYDAKDVEDAASFAAKKTGVRKDFIMGMLVVESDLGRYTGGCTYAEVEKGAEQRYKSGKLSKASWATFQRRRDIFKDIAKSLDKNYAKLKVSCNPASYYGTGGAMGVPQFMPDTWMGYKARIASATGHNPPDPWNLTDGVMAMAIKLSVVPGVTKHDRSGERNAAKLYLSGTTSSKYNWYADKVLYWADNYERLLGD